MKGQKVVRFNSKAHSCGISMTGMWEWGYYDKITAMARNASLIIRETNDSKS